MAGKRHPMHHQPTDQTIGLGHGSGGAAMQQLIRDELLSVLPGQNPDALEDAAVLDLPPGRIAFTTDSFTVQPLEFPGGNIGHLAVHGTVNDLAMRGARPLYLSVGMIIEEGLPLDTLRRIVASLGEAAHDADVSIVAGDTKVVGRGQADGIFINTSGIGTCGPHAPSVAAARPGDLVLVNGTMGDHGVAVMIAREDLQVTADLRSDTAALYSLVEPMLAAGGEGIHTLRDLTRGGLAAGLNEIASSSGVGISVDSRAIPVRPEVGGVCEILGLSPYAVANEGKLVAMVAPDAADAVLEAMREHPLGADAAIIGEATDARTAERGAGATGLVRVTTAIGTTRVLELPAGELLPRIC
ncbi:MAG TPA: hydrogenase expression/formation protein HypE [Armatimonadetes bacterium]|nr:hydrogenase expression/formation protein HypE [Armatimonadota bacterium]